jgi:DNA-binding IclR family transcriptional regulator
LAPQSSYSARLDIGTAAQHTATLVIRRCNETVQVGLLDGRKVLYIARADSTHMVRLVSAVGRQLPAHCTAIGKVLLAELDPAELAQRLRGVELERYTPQSITDPRLLTDALARIRETGLGENDRESNPEVCCVAAPVRDITGACVAAISISVPQARMTPASRPVLIEAVRSGAAELSATLGFGALPNRAPYPTATQGAH